MTRSLQKLSGVARILGRAGLKSVEHRQWESSVITFPQQQAWASDGLPTFQLYDNILVQNRSTDHCMWFKEYKKGGGSSLVSPLCLRYWNSYLHFIDPWAAVTVYTHTDTQTVYLAYACAPRHNDAHLSVHYIIVLRIEATHLNQSVTALLQRFCKTLYSRTPIQWALSSFSLQWLEQFINKIIADSAKQFTLRMRSTLFYWQLLLFFSLPVCLDLRGFGLKGSGLARFYCT